MSKTKLLIYVDDSPIHGKGLFSRKHIGAGELIGILDGVPTSSDGEDVLWLDEENGFHVQCDLRYINHSDEPNAAYYYTLEVCALTDIAPGEEPPSLSTSHSLRMR
jgi:SET domain-containing protein